MNKILEIRLIDHTMVFWKMNQGQSQQLILLKREHHLTLIWGEVQIQEGQLDQLRNLRKSFQKFLKQLNRVL